MKSTLLLIVLIVAFQAQAQHPKAVLTDGDLDKFIKTIASISDEIRSLDITVFPDALLDLDEMESVLPIFEKYGWSKGFGDKWYHIVCLQAVADSYEMLNIGKEKIFCDDLQLNPEDLKKVKPRSEELLDVIIRGFSG